MRPRPSTRPKHLVTLAIGASLWLVALAGTTPRVRADGVVFGTPFSIPEGISQFEAVAQFDPLAFGKGDCNGFAATIDFGDGSTQSGSVFMPANQPILTCLVSTYAYHAFADEGSYSGSVTVTETSQPLSAETGSVAITVTEGDVLTGQYATGLTATAGVPFPALLALALFDDTWTGNTASDFVASILWGDGTAAGTGTIGPAFVHGGAASYKVTGSHTYTAAGTYYASIGFSDGPPGTATSVVTSTIVVAAAPPTPTPTPTTTPRPTAAPGSTTPGPTATSAPTAPGPTSVPSSAGSADPASSLDPAATSAGSSAGGSPAASTSDIGGASSPGASVGPSGSSGAATVPTGTADPGGTPWLPVIVIVIVAVVGVNLAVFQLRRRPPPAG